MDDLDVATNDEELIDKAAQILVSYRRIWGWKDAEITQEDNRLRDYCLALFRYSRTPKKLIKSISETQNTHVGLAAAYGLVDLLEVFQALDPECLDRPNSHNRNKRPLVQAAWAHENAVVYLLDQGVDPVAKDTDGWPAIEGSIYRGETGIFLQILEKTLNVKPPRDLDYPNGLTLLHQCAYHNRVHMAEDLIDKYGFDPKAKSESEWQPLHSAAAAGAKETFEYFRNKTELDAKTKGGFTCLHLAAANGQNTLIKTILQEKDKDKILTLLDDYDQNALHHAAREHHINCLKTLLEYLDLDPNQQNKQKNCPIHLAVSTIGSKGISDEAIQEDMLETVKVLLLDERTDPNIKNERGQTPLALAKKMPKVQRWLLNDQRLDLQEPIEKGGEAPYTLAARLGVWSVFERYINEQDVPIESDLDGNGNSFLHLLAYKYSPLHLLDNYLVDIDDQMLNAQNNAGDTPIALAIQKENWPVVERLLDTGRVDLLYGKSEIQGFLSLALQSNADKELIEKIITTYPDTLKEEDFMGRTVLHQACGNQLQDWLDKLIPLIKDKQLWLQEDLQGFRPIDLLHPDPDARDSLDLPYVEKPENWPDTKSWDSKLPWFDLERKERNDLINNLIKNNLIRPDGFIDNRYQIAETTQIMNSELSFYKKGIHLIRIKDSAWKPTNPEIYYLSLNDQLYRLNGTSPPIHDVNSEAGREDLFSLTQDNALDYLRFFCFFVRGDEGPFLIFESVDQREIPADLTEEDRAKIAKFAHPSWHSVSKDGDFYAAAMVYYSNAIFAARFKIMHSGIIEMLNDIPVVANLSARVNRPIS